ncbi:MAG TPA: hypothetical protein VFO10_02765 [Oligoflexus sp.]|uniref:hypothetical protein n=1 Tax=Oligoflexus sp. TaxID=1971216 RepID=UPI002D7F897C|nr:hypothetical protein [Oligoflexus sp.]HET9236144.1 hypothetical protein [Oligoflexus sp.]
MLKKEDLLINIGTCLEKNLVSEEKRRKVISRIAAGAAFESWLSIETRLAIEENRVELQLDSIIENHGHSHFRFGVDNELAKVDLGIVEYSSKPMNWDWLLALEFKLLHNNKNWPKQCAGIFSDIFPDPSSKKAEIMPRMGRFAIVGVVGKVYLEFAGGYPGQRSDLEEWEKEVWSHLYSLTDSFGNKLKSLWSSHKFRLDGSDFLVKPTDVQHFFQFHIIGSAAPD